MLNCSLSTREVLALSTWTELLGREEALRRGRAICDRVLDVPSGLRRDPAAYAAELLAHAGEIEAAVRCLEVGLCKFDRSVFETNDPYLWYMPDYFGYLGDDSIRRLFPRDSEGWVDAGGDWGHQPGQQTGSEQQAP